MIKETLNLYSKSINLETYVKVVFAIIAVLVLMHNIFIAGNSYDYSTYENIKTIELSIVGIMVLIIFIIAGIAMSNNSKVTRQLKEASKRYTVKLETVQEEFNALAIHYYGGRGVVLKK